MGKFKCPHCGHIQNRDGVCEGCDISKVLPINNKPDFIKGVRYKCDSCNNRFRSYYDTCPKCGAGKLMPQYKNHRRQKKSSKLVKFVITVVIVVALIFGTRFALHYFYPDVEVRVSDAISIKASELKNRFSSFFSSITIQGNLLQLSNDWNSSQQQNKPQKVSVLPEMHSIGEMATIGGLEFTINKMVFSDYPGDKTGYGSKDSDYKYCVVYLDVYNPSNNTVEIREEEIINSTAVCYFIATLLFDGEVSYSQSFGHDTGFFFANSEILPRANLTNKVISFKVPVSITTSDAPLVFSLSDKGKDNTAWELR